MARAHDYAIGGGGGDTETGSAMPADAQRGVQADGVRHAALIMLRRHDPDFRHQCFRHRFQHRKAGCIDPVVIGDQHAADCGTVYGHLGLSCNAVCDRAERRVLAGSGRLGSTGMVRALFISTISLAQKSIARSRASGGREWSLTMSKTTLTEEPAESNIKRILNLS